MAWMWISNDSTVRQDSGTESPTVDTVAAGKTVAYDLMRFDPGEFTDTVGYAIPLTELYRVGYLEPVMEPVLDAEGAPVLDAQGQPTFTPVLDAQGQPVQALRQIGTPMTCAIPAEAVAAALNVKLADLVAQYPDIIVGDALALSLFNLLQAQGRLPPGALLP